MSVNNLQTPNSYQLYSQSLSCSDLTVANTYTSNTRFLKHTSNFGWTISPPENDSDSSLFFTSLNVGLGDSTMVAKIDGSGNYHGGLSLGEGHGEVVTSSDSVFAGQVLAITSISSSDVVNHQIDTTLCPLNGIPYGVYVRDDLDGNKEVIHTGVVNVACNANGGPVSKGDILIASSDAGFAYSDVGVTALEGMTIGVALDTEDFSTDVLSDGVVDYKLVPCKLR